MVCYVQHPADLQQPGPKKHTGLTGSQRSTQTHRQQSWRAFLASASISWGVLVICSGANQTALMAPLEEEEGPASPMTLDSLSKSKLSRA